MKIVVTGAESFVGRYLIPLCIEQGHHVVGLDAVPPSFAGGLVCDITSSDVADLIPDGTDVLVHLAAISRDPDCRANPKLAWDVNVGGTVNLIAQAKSRNVKQVVFASSEWVYGDVKNDAVQTEEATLDIARIRSEYAATKMAGEAVVRLGVESGDLPSASILRFGIIYAARRENWSAVEALVNNVLKKDVITVGCLGTARRFIHVADIVNGIMASFGRPGFEVLNLSGDHLVTLEEIIETAKRVSGRSPKVEESQPGQASVRNPVNDKIKSTLDWEPSVPIEAGIRGLVEYFKTDA